MRIDNTLYIGGWNSFYPSNVKFENIQPSLLQCNEG